MVRRDCSGVATVGPLVGPCLGGTGMVGNRLAFVGIHCSMVRSLVLLVFVVQCIVPGLEEVIVQLGQHMAGIPGIVPLCAFGHFVQEFGVPLGTLADIGIGSCLVHGCIVRVVVRPGVHV